MFQTNNTIIKTSKDDNTDTPFWIFDPKQLLIFDKMDNNMDILNLVSRYSILAIGVILAFNLNKKFIYIPLGLILGCIIFFIIDWSTQDKTSETEPITLTGLQSDADSAAVKADTVKVLDENDECTVPTIDNPYMNPLYWKEDGDKPACSYDEYKEDINDFYNFNLYKDVSDIFSRSDTERQFYTMPITTVQSRQGDFSNWLYRSEQNCKTDGVTCLEHINLRYK